MPIYSSEAADLVKEFEAALLEQQNALSNLVAALNSGAFANMAKAAEIIEFHNDRVMKLDARLQPYRLDKA